MISVVLACAYLSANAQERRAPNVIFILADDLGWRDTAVYGSTFYETSHIDALTQSGRRSRGGGLF